MKKALVACFSVGGRTAKAGKLLAEAVQADWFEIRPAVPYERRDLNWMDKNARSTVEMADKSSRPAIAGTVDTADYDVIFLGFPIWWYVAPTIVNTFLESIDTAGKTIVLFATSGGSDFGETVRYLRPSAAESAVILEGRVLNGRNTAEELRRWVESLGL